MKIDYSKLQTANAQPEASAMMETLRAIGYTLETAVADIIDNSITAGAKNVWISRIWDGDNSSLCIKDDGHGMSSEEVIQALKPGAKNPTEKRDVYDLGRFGLGLKTASLSQCRRLNVFSKRRGSKCVSWAWDLDYVDKCHQFNVIKWLPEAYKDNLDDVSSGTCVIWEEMDRIVPDGTSPDDEMAKQKFTEMLSRVRQHVAMIFHRFLNDNDLTIWWGENPIEPWDPYCRDENKIQPIAVDEIECHHDIVRIEGFVLPHKDDFSSEQAYKEAEGINGYPAQQGFYVYRGKRMLIAGDWLGLFRKEEHYKLARILVDLPNTLDTQWQIDIKKSTAIPPHNCKEFLRSYAKKVRSTAVEVFRHKGRIIKRKAGAKFQTMWQEKKVGNSIYFVVNRQHAFVSFLKEMARTKPDKAIDMLLNFVEESVPKQSIYISELDGQSEKTPIKEMSPQFEKNLHFIAEELYKKLRSDGTTAETAKEQLKTQAPFDEFAYIIDELHD